MVGIGMLLCACPGDDQPPIIGAEVELGTGTTDYAPLLAEATLDLIAGPQGGHHFIVHARMRRMAPGDPMRPGQAQNPASTFAAYAEDGHQLDLMNPPYRLGYVMAADGWYELPSGRILQLEETEVAALDGVRVRIVAIVRDAFGAEGNDERWIIARPGVLLPGEDAGPADAAMPTTDGARATDGAP